ncbi:universal stress protein [Halobacteria archaeon AArc-curdl1]|uniref:Universal stress protein n=1 Tax=Natronosalvus hydrolyticus TaxID=2979988 RepID=A0AAP3E535_9EURY|nr:universal stress protein [Halobacteria archaeon AArc-curdl1]
MYEEILLTTDGSELATRACEHGLWLADQVGAAVHVVHVVLPEDASDTERADAAIEPVRSSADERDLSIDSSVRSGSPATEILEYAGEHGVDLIVCGTHGRTGIRRLVTGSVAGRVIRDAKVPVLSVTPTAGATRTEMGDILLATDDRRGTEGANEQALDLASALEADLHALSVVDDTGSRLEVVLEAFEEQAESAVEAIQSSAADREVSVTGTIERGEPSREIIDYAERQSVDLIVMGTESRSGLERFVFGSCSQRVVSTAPVPVLTVRTL